MDNFKIPPHVAASMIDQIPDQSDREDVCRRLSSVHLIDINALADFRLSKSEATPEPIATEADTPEPPNREDGYKNLVESFARNPFPWEKRIHAVESIILNANKTVDEFHCDVDDVHALHEEIDRLEELVDYRFGSTV